MNKESDSIVRYCKPTQIQDGKVLAGAFYLRKKDPMLNRPEDEKDLSVHQFEFFFSDSFKNLKSWMPKSGLKLKPEGCFAKIKYSDVANDIKNFMSLNIDIIQDVNSPHCSILNLYQRDEEAAYFFLKNIKEVVRIKDIV